MSYPTRCHIPSFLWFSHALWIFSFQVFCIHERVYKSMWVWWLNLALLHAPLAPKMFFHIVEDLQFSTPRGVDVSMEGWHWRFVFVAALAAGNVWCFSCGEVRGCLITTGHAILLGFTCLNWLDFWTINSYEAIEVPTVTRHRFYRCWFPVIFSRK